LVLFQIIAYLAIDAELMASAIWKEVKVLTSIKARNWGRDCAWRNTFWWNKKLAPKKTARACR
jgi:hypothetical protein